MKNKKIDITLMQVLNGDELRLLSLFTSEITSFTLGVPVCSWADWDKPSSEDRSESALLP